MYGVNTGQNQGGQPGTNFGYQNGALGVPPGVYTPAPRPNFRVIPVGSYDEARAVPTDFMGNTLFLTDFSHGKIYTKVLDPATGSPVFKSYSLDPDTVQAEPKLSPIEHTELQSPPYDAKGEIDRIREELNELKKELGIKEDKS